MTRAEQEARELLKESGATMLRISGNHHEVWNLPNGRHFTCNKKGASSGFRAWKNNLSTLKKLMREALTVPPPMATIKAEVAKPRKHFRRIRKRRGKKPKPQEAKMPKAPAMLPTTVEGATIRKPANPNDYNKWTDEHKAIVREGFEAKYDDEEICVLLIDLRPDVSPNAVKSVRRRLGLVQINRQRWEKSHDRIMRRLVKEGLTDKEIVSDHRMLRVRPNVTVASIANRRHILRLKANKAPSRPSSTKSKIAKTKQPEVEPAPYQMHPDRPPAPAPAPARGTRKVVGAMHRAVRYLDTEVLADDLERVCDLAKAMCGSHRHEEIDDDKAEVEAFRTAMRMLLRSLG